jgi:uncharacterized membrane protein YwaF
MKIAQIALTVLTGAFLICAVVLFGLDTNDAAAWTCLGVAIFGWVTLTSMILSDTRASG